MAACTCPTLPQIDAARLAALRAHHRRRRTRLAFEILSSTTSGRPARDQRTANDRHARDRAAEAAPGGETFLPGGCQRLRPSGHVAMIPSCSVLRNWSRRGQTFQFVTSGDTGSAASTPCISGIRRVHAISPARSHERFSRRRSPANAPQHRHRRRVRRLGHPQAVSSDLEFRHAEVPASGTVSSINWARLPANERLYYAKLRFKLRALRFGGRVSFCQRATLAIGMTALALQMDCWSAASVVTSNDINSTSSSASVYRAC